MGTMNELRRATGAARCVECGKCTTMCPLVSWGGFSARRIMADEPFGVEAGRSAPGFASFASGTRPAVGVQHCLTCGACEVRCPQDVHYTEYVRGLRGRLPAAERLPAPHGGVLQSAARGMAASVPRAALDWLGDGLQVVERGEVALFCGCARLFDALFADDLGINPLETTRAAVRLLNRAGIAPVVVGAERCCGHDLLWAGDDATFQDLAQANAELFATLGVKRIITPCAECARTWRLDYPRVVTSYQPNVEHMAEFVADALERGTLVPAHGGDGLLTYQDACRLGRHMGVFDAPRAVLRAVAGDGFVEMDRSGRDAQCCGTSGFVYCDAASRRLQAERLGAARATGSRTLVTSCPKCLIHFSCAQADLRRGGADGAQLDLQIVDLTVVAASRLVAGVPAEGGPAPRAADGGAP